MTTINLAALAADLESHMGARPPLIVVTEAATDLATTGVHHLIGRDGTLVILAREHYESVPDDARALAAPPVLHRIGDGPDRRRPPIAPDIVTALVVLGFCLWFGGLFAGVGSWPWSATFTLLAVGAGAWLIELVRGES